MPFGVKRSASRARSVDSISTLNDDFRDLDVTADIQVNETLNLNLTDKEYKTLNRNPDMQNSLNQALQDPLKKLWAKIINHHNNTLKQDETPINLDEMTDAFKHSVSFNEQDVKNLIDKSQKNLKSDLYQKNLSFHLLNPRFKPPTLFSPYDVLHSASKSAEALKLFPTQNKSKFSGIRGEPPSLSEFIYSINYAQDRLCLSESEFTQKLLTSLTGPAHESIRNLAEQGEKVSSLYHTLTHLYDHSLDPVASKAKLSKLIIPRKWDLFTAQNKIIELATAAARLFKENQRKTITNTEACQTLIRALPPVSSKLVRTQFNQFMTDQTDDSTEPLFIDFIRYLSRFADDINDDIRANGAPYEDRESRFKDRSQERRYTPQFTPYKQHRPLRVQTTFSYQRNPSSYFNRYSPYPQGANEVSVQQLNSSAPIKNKYLNKLYCSLCGKNTHTASQGCYAIKRNGTVVPCPPTQIPCHICEKTTQKQLFHPPSLCFNKDLLNSQYKRKNSFNSNKQNNY